MNRRLIIGAQIVVTAVLLRLLFRSFDWPAFVAVLRRLSVGMYLGSLLVVAVGQVLYALRWRAVLVAMRISIPLVDVLRQYAIGIFFSNLMPTAIGGDATKVYYLGHAAGYLEVGAVKNGYDARFNHLVQDLKPGESCHFKFMIPLPGAASGERFTNLIIL